MTKLIDEQDYSKLYEFFEYEFKDSKLLDEAFTHKGLNHDMHYERLEFLGDRVVNLVVADILFDKFKKEPEGDLAKRHAALVRKEALSKIALFLGLDGYIMLSKYDEAERANISLLADICEAVMGALFLDAGFLKVKEIIEKYWHDMIFSYKTPPMDSKTKLQEWAQARKLPPPTYEVVACEGADHAPTFIVKSTLIGLEPKVGKGGSKREAEQNAAKEILNGLKK